MGPKSTATPAVPVAGAQQWMCAPVAPPPIRPEKLSVTCRVLRASLSVTVAKPIAGDPVGVGRSLAPLSAAVKMVTWASAGVAASATMAAAPMSRGAIRARMLISLPSRW